MAIVTLTTDLGIKDHYVAMIKGKLLTKTPELQIVDISHEIKPFSIQQAAFVLRNAYPYFPAGSVHLVSVLADHKASYKVVIIECKKQFFAGIDNGIFALTLDDEPDAIYEIASTSTCVFPVRDLLCDAIGDFVNGTPLTTIGRKIQNLESRTFLKAPESSEYINGIIVYIDRFGNAIINITKEKFERKRNNREYTIHWKRANEFEKIHDNYNAVPGGEKLCLFNSNGFLEIAINQGNAAQMLGLRLDDTIQIEFFE
jgi:hypothetical protein